MTTIYSGELPEGAMLKRYEHDRSYIECYYMDLPRAISIDEYVSAFYTTTLFKVERCILALVQAGARLMRAHRNLHSGWYPTLLFGALKIVRSTSFFCVMSSVARGHGSW